ncbi:oligosaccharide flippase family protein [Microbulbifer elongatus]|uniref:oligosaccharide flippase family protein n=1 Tax=Microbulbifer elongatus TaxID=86173 RepID=UPI001CFCC816|nr:oligosaccharide flippase family protein [Microbulbifer elongatus]
MTRPKYVYATGALARNTIWLMTSQAIRIFVQAAYFLLITRTLGAQGYGIFAGVVSLTTILAAFAGMGSGHILIKNVARAPDSFSHYWGITLTLLLATSIPLTSLLLLLGILFLPPEVPAEIVVTIAIADLIFAPLVLICSQSFQGFQRIREAATILLILALSRLMTALAMGLKESSPTPEDWANFYLAGTIIATVISFYFVRNRLSAHFKPQLITLKELREGFSFSLSNSGQRGNNDIDKTMLLRLDTAQSAGLYSAAYRIVEVAFMPVTALLSAAYSRFFQQGANGLSGSRNYALKLLAPATGYAALSTIIIYFFAPYLPMLLGDGFESTESVARWLAIMPLLLTLYTTSALALTGAGHQNLRTGIEISTLGINLVLNLWWIPIYSYYGAVWATLSSRLLATAATMYFLYKISPQQQSNANAI